jgi:SOS-response transcriptional repressor LexA
MDDEGMVDRGIHAGDLVLVNPSARARDGDAVAARLGERCLVRTVAHRGALLAFTPAAAGEAEIVVGPDDDFQVLGVVAAVLRPFHDQPGADAGPVDLTVEDGRPAT